MTHQLQNEIEFPPGLDFERLDRIQKEWEKSSGWVQALIAPTPKEPKVSLRQQIRDVSHAINDLLLYRRLWKGKLITDVVLPGDKWFIEWVIEHTTKRMEKLDQKLKNLKWQQKPGKGELNIPKAKAVPCTQLLEFNRQRLARCPWHGPDKHPSLKYYKDNNTVWCFSCNHGGDSIDIVQKLYNLTFQEAVKKLTG